MDTSAEAKPNLTTTVADVRSTPLGRLTRAAAVAGLRFAPARTVPDQGARVTFTSTI